jgi:hypothetical protein
MSIHPDILTFDDDKAKEYLRSLISRRTNIYTSPHNYFSCIADNLNYSFYIHALACTWYYARKKPFNNDNFLGSKALFDLYTSHDREIPIEVDGKYIKSYYSEQDDIVELDDIYYQEPVVDNDNQLQKALELVSK